MPPKINTAECTGCGVCVETCPTSVLKLQNDKCLIANPGDCTDCQSCSESCASSAIVF